MIEITIPGKPIAKKRPRFYRRGNYVGTYNAQETEEGRFMWELKQQFSGPPIEDPVSLEVIFFMPIPKSAPKKIAWEIVKHVKKPDLDNLVKFVKDCCNGLLWRDDSQVWKIRATKEYSHQPGTWIRVEE